MENFDSAYLTRKDSSYGKDDSFRIDSEGIVRYKSYFFNQIQKSKQMNIKSKNISEVIELMQSYNNPDLQPKVKIAVELAQKLRTFVLFGVRNHNKLLHHDFSILNLLVNGYNGFVMKAQQLIESSYTYLQQKDKLEEINGEIVLGSQQDRNTDPPTILIQQLFISRKQSNYRDSNSRDSLIDFVSQVDYHRISDQKRETVIEEDIDCSMNQNQKTLSDEDFAFEMWDAFEFLKYINASIIIKAKRRRADLQRTTIMSLKAIRKYLNDQEEFFKC
ncbi:hypothetical protein OXYTRIMIC_475 [Oxytricha trifallax]|uniref:Uncharacterized protein n=1 Tax=Oxytricha trifallax TaxID=1172189 RepID=A0A073HZ82_9SPIT|nr:hypothetical protein OXYTRIMIC_475 [Oxytricha trifallax]